MSQITTIDPREHVRFDQERLCALARNLGAESARDVVIRATDELTIRLMQLRAANAGENLEAIRRLTRSISTTADRIGMITLARVSMDVAACADRRDRTAFRATFARLQRIAEICLLDAFHAEDQRL